jgi:hypothetical protein
MRHLRPAPLGSVAIISDADASRKGGRETG